MHVQPGGEVAVADFQARGHHAAAGHRHVSERVLPGLRRAEKRRVGLVVLAGDAGQYPQLGAGQLAVRNGDAQHGREALDIPAVLQPQRAELIIPELPGKIALQLVAILGRALLDELPVEVCVLVHRAPTLRGRFISPNYFFVRSLCE